MRWDNAREQLKEGVRRMAAAATISAGGKGQELRKPGLVLASQFTQGVGDGAHLGFRALSCLSHISQQHLLSDVMLCVSSRAACPPRSRTPEHGLHVRRGSDNHASVI